MPRDFNAPKKGDRHNEPVYDRSLITIDWGEVREKYHARLEQEIARGVDNEETRAYLEAKAEGFKEPTPKPRRAKTKPKKPGPGRGSNNRGKPAVNRTPEEIIDQFVRLYGVGLTTHQIGKALDKNADVVRQCLRLRGVYDPNRDRNGRKNDA